MATLKKTILGRLSGTIGDIVFRQKNGKNFAASKPAHFKTPSDAASLARRARFRLTLKFAQAVTALQSLKELWSAHAPSGLTVNNFIIRQNYSSISHEEIGSLASIVPQNGFGVSVSSSDVSVNGVNVELDPIGTDTGINPSSETSMRLTAVLYLTNPVDSSSEPYAFISLLSPPVATDLENPVAFTATLSNQQRLLYEQYQDAKPFLSILTYTEEGNIVHYARTFSG